MAEISLLASDIIKMVCMVLLIYGACRVLTSPLKNEKSRKFVAMITFVPMGIIAVVSFAQSLAMNDPLKSANVLMAGGFAAVALSVLMLTEFGRHVLANVVGNTVYDILKSAFRILMGASSAMLKIFRRPSMIMIGASCRANLSGRFRRATTLQFKAPRTPFSTLNRDSRKTGLTPL